MKLFTLLTVLLLIIGCGNDDQGFELLTEGAFSQQQIDSILTKFNFDYQNPIFLDSSAHILFPMRINSTDKSWRSFSSKSYSKNERQYWNILFFHQPSGQTKLLTDVKTNIIEYTVNLKNTGPLLAKSILYKAITNDYNQNQQLDYSDPSQLYISENDGTNYRKLSPEGEDLVWYSFLPKTDIIILKTRRNTNRDLAFNQKDETILYTIDLKNNTKPKEIIDTAGRKNVEQLFLKQWLVKKEQE